MTQTDPRALVNLAREAEQRGDATRSLQLYDDALTLLGDERDLPLLADALRWKGTLHREQGETEIAYRCYKQSLMHAETCGSVSCRAHVYNCLAIIAQRRGNLAESERLYAQAFELASKAGDIRLLGMIEQNRGVLLNMRGNFVAAEARYSNSLGSFERANDEEAISWVLNNIGMLYTKLGHYQRAVEIFERGLGIARTRSDALVESILTLNEMPSQNRAGARSVRRQHRDASDRDLRSRGSGRQAAAGGDAEGVWADVARAGEPG